MEGTARGNEELKAQGVVEAARDPNSSVNAADAEKALKDHAQAGGAAAFEFNPDASPEEKAAQAKAVSECQWCGIGEAELTAHVTASRTTYTSKASDCCLSDRYR